MQFTNHKSVASILSLKPNFLDQIVFSDQGKGNYRSDSILSKISQFLKEFCPN